MTFWRRVSGGARSGSSNRPRQPARPPRFAPLCLLCGALMWLSVLVILFGAGGRQQTELAVGQRAPNTVVAAADFECRDIARSELSRQEAADAVLPVFSLNLTPLTAAQRSLDKLFDRLAQIRQATAVRAEQLTQISDVLDLLGLNLAPEEALQLAPAGMEAPVREVLRGVLLGVWQAGIVSPAERQTAFQGVAGHGRLILQAAPGTELTPVAVERLRTPEEALRAVIAGAQERARGVKLSEPALRNLLPTWLGPNLLYDQTSTEKRRARAAEAAAAVTMKVRVGSTLVEAGDRLTPQILEQLTAHKRRLDELESPYERLVKRSGAAGLLLGVLLICGGMLYILRPELLRQPPRMLLLLVLSLLNLLPAKGLLALSLTSGVVQPTLVAFLLPLALPPLLAAILLDGAAALALGFWGSFATAVLFENSFVIFTLGLALSVVATLSAREVHKRASLYRAGLWVGLTSALFALGQGAVTQQVGHVMASQAIAGLLSGLVCALVASLLLPLFEVSFQITTDLTLLELSDLGHPLLERLALEAPGTYHHSLMVANLGQAAAAAIGANDLLVRVGAYYHDIGKLGKPEFFMENIRHRDNPHDHLTPSMSTLVIQSHIKEGVSLARRYKLPACVVDGILQHHGSSLVSYFYQRARQQQEAGDAPGHERLFNEDDFRYEGPRPQSPEMAVLLLADAVEATARSLSKSTPSRLENMVQEIVEAKLRDGQLDEARVTLAQLSAIKRSFLFTLSSMYHGRSAYPAAPPDENLHPQSPGKGAADSEAAAPAQPVAGLADT